MGDRVEERDLEPATAVAGTRERLARRATVGDGGEGRGVARGGPSRRSAGRDQRRSAVDPDRRRVDRDVAGTADDERGDERCRRRVLDLDHDQRRRRRRTPGAARRRRARASRSAPRGRHRVATCRTAASCAGTRQRSSAPIHQSRCQRAPCGQHAADGVHARAAAVDDTDPSHQARRIRRASSGRPSDVAELGLGLAQHERGHHVGRPQIPRTAPRPPSSRSACRRRTRTRGRGRPPSS